MAFTWTTPITAGSAKVTLANLNEARNNADYLDNNLACGSHYTTNLGSHLSGNNASQLASYCGGNYPWYNGFYLTCGGR